MSFEPERFDFSTSQKGKSSDEDDFRPETPVSDGGLSKNTPTRSKTQLSTNNARKFRKPRRAKTSFSKADKDASALDLPSLMVPIKKSKNKNTKPNKLRKTRPKTSTEEINIDGFDPLPAVAISPKQPDSDDAASNISETRTPAKYRKHLDSSLSKMNQMKLERVNSSKPIFSRALQKSLADMSNQVLLKKKSMSVTDEENEKEVNKEADKHMSQVLVTKTINKPLQDLSKMFKFGGFAYDDYDCFQKNPDYFVKFYSDAFEALELSSVYNDNSELLAQFIGTVRENYRTEEQVPFHNFFHGFSVGQVAVTFVLRNFYLKRLFDRKLLFTLIVASIMHDVDHPGNDNFYELISNSKRSAKHGPNATLENHHSEKMLELMKADDGSCSIFKYLSHYNQDVVFEHACDLILATDMSRHKEKLNFLLSLKDLKALRGDDEESERKQEEFLQCIIHACDLSGQCFNTKIAIRWEENIHKEMTNQYKKLVKDKLQIPSHMTRFTLKGRAARKARYSSQAKFIENVLVPYWSEIVRLMPEMSDFLTNLKANGKYFAKKSNSIRK